MPLPKKKLISKNERSGELGKDVSIAPGREKIKAGEIRIGLSKQASIKVAEFQYNKIGFWMERVVPDNDKDINMNMLDMSERIDDFIEQEVNDFYESKKQEEKTKRR